MTPFQAMRLRAAGAGANPFVPVFFNPLDKGANIILSNSDRTAGNTSSAWATVRTTVSKSSGKWYAEGQFAYTTTTSSIFGVCTGSHTLTNFVGSGAGGWGLQASGGAGKRTLLAGTITNQGTAITNGQSGKIAFDIDAGNGWMAKVGDAWIGGGDPAAGTSPTFTFTPGTTLYLAASAFSSTVGTVTLPSSAYTDPIPSGFTGFG